MVKVKGPIDRRLTAGRRLSVTGIHELAEVHALSVHASSGILTLSSRLLQNVPAVAVRRTKAGRLELDFTKRFWRTLAIAGLDPVGGKSIPLDVFVVLRGGGHVELSCVRRGKHRPV